MTSVAPIISQSRAGVQPSADAASAGGSGVGFQNFMAAFLASLQTNAKTTGAAVQSAGAQAGAGLAAATGPSANLADGAANLSQGLLLKRSVGTLAGQAGSDASGVATSVGTASAKAPQSAVASIYAALSQLSISPEKATKLQSGTPQANAPASQTGAVSANSDNIADALKQLGFTDADIAQFLANVPQGHAAPAKSTKSATHDLTQDGTAQVASTATTQAAAPVSGPVIAPAVQPPQTTALGFVADPGTILNAAAQVISAVVSQAGSSSPVVATAATSASGPAATTLLTTGAQTVSIQDGAVPAGLQGNFGLPAPAVNTAGVPVAGVPVVGVPGAAVPVAASATNQTAQASNAAHAANAALAQQGVISIAGQAAPAVASNAVAQAPRGHTIADQAGSPTLADPKQPLADVAIATIQQASSNMPLTRMSEIRAKLQAAQLGTTKSASASGSGSVSSTPDAVANPDTGASKSTGAVATGAGAVEQALQRAFASAGAGSGTGTPIDPRAAQAGEKADPVSDQSGSAVAGLTDSSQTAAGLTGINQGQTQLQQVQPTEAQNPAIPLSAVASTIVAHAKAGDSEFNIRLDPAGLGQVDVKLKVSSDGEVRAHMIVDQPATLDLMMRDRQQLQQSLDQAGFKTDPSSLQFSLRDQGQGQSQNQGQQQSPQNQSGQTANARQSDTALTPLQSAVYGRQSYIRADGVDVSV